LTAIFCSGIVFVFLNFDTLIPRAFVLYLLTGMWLRIWVYKQDKTIILDMKHISAVQHKYRYLHAKDVHHVDKVGVKGQTRAFWTSEQGRSYLWDTDIKYIKHPIFLCSIIALFVPEVTKILLFNLPYLTFRLSICIKWLQNGQNTCGFHKILYLGWPSSNFG
jgi:hypothetical protein